MDQEQEYVYHEQEFYNREGKDLNRIKIVIVDQNANEIIADVIPFETEVTNEGTELNADLMTEFQKAITYSLQQVKDAKNAAQNALNEANDAKNKAQLANDNVVGKQGTKVTKNGSFVLDFNADEKVDVTVFNTLVESFEALKERVETLEQKVVALEGSPIMTKVTYDATTKTFKI